MAFIKYRHVSIEYFSHLIAVVTILTAVSHLWKWLRKIMHAIWKQFERWKFFAFCNAWTTWIINEGKFLRVGRREGGSLKFIVDGKINWWLMLSDKNLFFFTLALSKHCNLIPFFLKDFQGMKKNFFI